MLAALFRSNRPAVLLLLIVLVPAVFLPAIWRMQVAPGPSMPLYGLVVQGSAGAVWLPGLLAVLVAGLLALQLGWAANGAELVGRRNYLPALLLPLLLGCSARPTVLEPALLGMPLVLAAMVRTWSIAGSNKVLGPLFDAGLLMGLAALFYLPYAFLVVVVWASVSVIRPLQWREYFLPTIGLVLVLYLAWALHVLSGGGPWRPLFTVLGQVPTGLRHLQLPTWLHVLRRTDLVLIVLVSAVYYTGSYQRGIMREKNLRASFLAFFFALGLIVGLLHVLDGSFPAVLLAAPLSVLGAYALLGERRKWLSELAVLVLVGCALWVQWA